MSQSTADPRALATYEQRLKRLNKVFQDSVHDRDTGMVLKREAAELASISKHKLCSDVNWKDYQFIQLIRRYRQMKGKCTPKTLHSAEVQFFESELQRSRPQNVDAPHPTDSGSGSRRLSKGNDVVSFTPGIRELSVESDDSQSSSEQICRRSRSAMPTDIVQPHQTMRLVKRKVPPTQDEEGPKKTKLRTNEKQIASVQDPLEKDASAQDTSARRTSAHNTLESRTQAQGESAGGVSTKRRSVHGKLPKDAARQNGVRAPRRETQWDVGLYWTPRCRWCLQNNLDCRVKMAARNSSQIPACLECARRKTTCQLNGDAKKSEVSGKPETQTGTDNDPRESDNDLIDQEERPRRKRRREEASTKKYILEVVPPKKKKTSESLDHPLHTSHTLTTSGSSPPSTKRQSARVSGVSRENAADTTMSVSKRRIATPTTSAITDHRSLTQSSVHSTQPGGASLASSITGPPQHDVLPSPATKSLREDIETLWRSLQGTEESASANKRLVEIMLRLESRVTEIENRMR